jgi:hypothetical protein
MYLWPALLLSRGPTTSIAILVKGTSMMGRLIRGAFMPLFEREVSWQVGQDLQPGQ